MKFFQDCWITLLELFNAATFTTTSGSAFQQALQHQGPLSDNPIQRPLPGNPNQRPIFTPPSGSEDKDSAIKCDYTALGPGWSSCSTETNRTCWLKGPGTQFFDIHTDYEKFAPIGITRKYTVTASEKGINGDGVKNPYGKVWNEIYPGPWIQACWGDTIEVKVINNLRYNGTTVHWHGIRQNGTLEMDGVNAVTQCPIAPGDHFTYRFKAIQYGTSWYHSHYSLQYGDGLVGPLTIHGPSSANYDEARDPILMTDWNHRSGFSDFQTELTAPPTPQMDSILLNGLGSYAGAGNNGYRYNTTVQRGKKYLLRLINTSVDTTFVFMIDHHNFSVISTDFVPIKPYVTDNVTVGIGQRYHIILDATPIPFFGQTTFNNKTNEYWIRTIPTTGCGGFVVGNQPDERQGILYYPGSNNTYPGTQRFPGSVNPLVPSLSLVCRDEPYNQLEPIIPWKIDAPVNDPDQFKNGEEFGLGLVVPPIGAGAGRPLPNDTFARWAIGGKPLFLNFSNPTIQNLQNTTWDPEYVVIPENYPADSWVYLLITSDNRTSDRRDVPAAHPIHLHGHDFALLQQSATGYNQTQTSLKLNNPPRRDVTLLPSGGFIVIAFKADNPGVWLLHCHIAWHASSGLAMQILERQGAAQKLFTAEKLQENTRVCTNWKTWFNNTKNYWHPEGGVAAFQDDSGI